MDGKARRLRDGHGNTATEQDHCRNRVGYEPPDELKRRRAGTALLERQRVRIMPRALLRHQIDHEAVGGPEGRRWRFGTRRGNGRKARARRVSARRERFASFGILEDGKPGGRQIGIAGHQRRPRQRVGNQRRVALVCAMSVTNAIPIDPSDSNRGATSSVARQRHSASYVLASISLFAGHRLHRPSARSGHNMQWFTFDAGQSEALRERKAVESGWRVKPTPTIRPSQAARRPTRRIQLAFIAAGGLLRPPQVLVERLDRGDGRRGAVLHPELLVDRLQVLVHRARAESPGSRRCRGWTCPAPPTSSTSASRPVTA